MNIGEIIVSDVANGPSVRLSIFVSGCKNHCKGCFNPETWDFNYGEKYTHNMREHIINELSKSYYKGITILGGDPFELENQKDVLDIILAVKSNLPLRDIWMYTGYTYESDLNIGGKRYIENTTEKILDNIDVLVDGRFELEKRNIKLRFRGSTNQRIIDMKNSRKSGNTILSDLN